MRARDAVPGSFSRSATTIWFSTSSLTMSISYSSDMPPFSGEGGRTSMMRGFRPVEETASEYTRIVARCRPSSSIDDQSSIRCLGIFGVFSISTEEETYKISYLCNAQK